MSLPEPVIQTFPPVPSYDLTVPSRQAFSHQRQGEIAEEIFELYQQRGCAVLSLDVFDTLLLRGHETEATRYVAWSHLVANTFAGRAARTLTWQDVLTARTAGILLTYRMRPAKEGVREGHIDDIFDAMQISLGLTDTERWQLPELELSFEKDHLHPNTAISALAMKVTAAGGQVVLLSDMYLGDELLTQLVKEMFPAASWLDHVFCSASSGLSKRGGTIFAYVEEQLGTDGEKILHLGDSYTSDFVRPKNAGWHALHLPVLRAEMRERTEDLQRTLSMLEKEKIKTRGWAQL